MTSCEDELVALATKGSQDAFRQLWEAHHAVAMASALRLCQRRTMAEEITQGAFLLAWRGLPGFTPGCPFRPWLLRIVYRHALDVMEKQKMYAQPLSLDDLTAAEENELATNGRNTLDWQENIASREEIHRALAQLSSEQRRVIALRYGADLTEVDIAQALAWPVGTVKSRLNRARERLRQLLQDEKGGSSDA